MIFHLILNSFIVFVVLSLLVELIVHLFKIQRPRFRYLCRLLPILKFPFDLIVFSVMGESFLYNYNPFSCEYEAYEMIKDMLPVNTDIVNRNEMVIPQYLANHLSESVLNGLIVFTVALSSIILFVKLMQLIHSKRYLDNLIKSSKGSQRIITNVRLSEALVLYKADILVSTTIHVPFAAKNRFIFVPSALERKFSQEEYEAVIAHELEHLRWNDPLIRIMSNILCATFWWIPTSWLLRKLEEDQEEASDDTIYRYDIEPYALGSALVKTVKNFKTEKLKMAAICPLTSTKKSHERRLHNLLYPKPQPVSGLTYIGALASIASFLSFWAC